MPTIRERVRALAPADRLRYETVAEQFDQAWATVSDGWSKVNVWSFAESYILAEA